MWLFTDTGFVSAVSDGSDLMVRSRDRESLVPLAAVAKVEIKKTPKNDYRSLRMVLRCLCQQRETTSRLLS